MHCSARYDACVGDSVGNGSEIVESHRITLLTPVGYVSSARTLSPQTFRVVYRVPSFKCCSKLLSSSPFTSHQPRRAPKSTITDMQHTTPVFPTGTSTHLCTSSGNAVCTSCATNPMARFVMRGLFPLASSFQSNVTCVGERRMGWAFLVRHRNDPGRRGG